MTVKTEETESQEALPNTKFEGKLQLALEGLNPSIRRSLLGISKRNSIYIIDFVINELKKENNASLNYVRMNVYAIADLVNHCKKSDLRKFTRGDVILQKVVLPLSSVPILYNHIQRQVTDYSCCKMLISFPISDKEPSYSPRFTFWTILYWNAYL